MDDYDADRMIGDAREKEREGFRRIIAETILNVEGIAEECGIVLRRLREHQAMLGGDDD